MEIKVVAMRWMLLFLCIFCQLQLQAAEQYSKFDCDNLKDRLAFMQKRSSAGYDINASSSTMAKDFLLMKEYNLHCQHPVDTTRVIRGAIQESQSSIYSDLQIQEMPSFSANNAIFLGAKAAAWEDFYQVPTQCRKKQLTETEFIWCAEHKTDQRAQFEQQWQPTNSAQAETSTLVSAAAEPRQTQQALIAAASEPTAVEPNGVQITETNDGPTALNYLQVLEEQNQRAKWYGVIILLLMSVAGLLVWRK
jgi:hypothetical protein